MVGQFCKRLLQKHEKVPFTGVNVAALYTLFVITTADREVPD